MGRIIFIGGYAHFNFKPTEYFQIKENTPLRKYKVEVTSDILVDDQIKKDVFMFSIEFEVTGNDLRQLNDGTYFYDLKTCTYSLSPFRLPDVWYPPYEYKYDDYVYREVDIFKRLNNVNLTLSVTENFSTKSVVMNEWSFQSPNNQVKEPQSLKLVRHDNYHMLGFDVTEDLAPREGTCYRFILYKYSRKTLTHEIFNIALGIPPLSTKRGKLRKIWSNEEKRWYLPISQKGCSIIDNVVSCSYNPLTLASYVNQKDTNGYVLRVMCEDKQSILMDEVYSDVSIKTSEIYALCQCLEEEPHIYKILIPIGSKVDLKPKPGSKLTLTVCKRNRNDSYQYGNVRLSVPVTYVVGSNVVQWNDAELKWTIYNQTFGNSDDSFEQECDNWEIESFNEGECMIQIEMTYNGIVKRFSIPGYVSCEYLRQYRDLKNREIKLFKEILDNANFYDAIDHRLHEFHDSQLYNRLKGISMLLRELGINNDEVEGHQLVTEASNYINQLLESGLDDLADDDPPPSYTIHEPDVVVPLSEEKQAESYTQKEATNTPIPSAPESKFLVTSNEHAVATPLILGIRDPKYIFETPKLLLRPGVNRVFGGDGTYPFSPHATAKVELKTVKVGYKYYQATGLLLSYGDYLVTDVTTTLTRMRPYTQINLFEDLTVRLWYLAHHQADFNDSGVFLGSFALPPTFICE